MTSEKLKKENDPWDLYSGAFLRTFVDEFEQEAKMYDDGIAFLEFPEYKTMLREFNSIKKYVEDTSMPVYDLMSDSEKKLLNDYRGLKESHISNDDLKNTLDNYI